jgi:tripartite-type tricarboxylate transporter receptor subunit TctC
MKTLLTWFVTVFALAAQADSLLTVTTSAPGGVPDTLARQIMLHYDRLYGQDSVTLVMNRPGAEGLIGIKYFVRETVDRDGVLFPATGHMASLDSSEYEQLVPLVEVVKQPMVLVVRNNFPGRTWEEFVSHVRVNPGKISVAITSRALSLPGAVKIQKNHGLELNYVTYSVNSAFYTDLFAGVVDAAWVPASAYFGGPMQSQSRAILVTGQKNIAGIPNELLYGNDKKVGEWYLSQGIFVSKTMPTDKKKLLASRFNDVIHNHWGKEFQTKNPGVLLGNKNVDSFTKTLVDYRRDWAELKNNFN